MTVSGLMEEGFMEPTIRLKNILSQGCYRGWLPRWPLEGGFISMCGRWVAGLWQLGGYWGHWGYYDAVIIGGQLE